MQNPNKRGLNESWPAYKTRQRMMTALWRLVKQGIVIWDSAKLGTYRKKLHGPIGSDL